MTLNNQTTSGNNSPNISDSSNVEIITNNYTTLTQQLLLRISNEVISILSLIELLSHKVSIMPEQELQAELEKEVNLKEKVEVRFSHYQVELKTELIQLTSLYGLNYEEATSQSGIDEGRAEEIAAYLARKSRKLLSECGGNPIEAIDNLANYFEEELKIKTGEVSYSQGAIRYYIYKELLKCNVFPNPLSA